MYSLYLEDNNGNRVKVCNLHSDGRDFHYVNGFGGWGQYLSDDEIIDKVYNARSSLAQLGEQVDSPDQGVISDAVPF